MRNIVGNFVIFVFELKVKNLLALQILKFYIILSFTFRTGGKFVIAIVHNYNDALEYSFFVHTENQRSLAV